MNADQLQVWLHDDPVAVLRRRRNQLQLAYTDEAVHRYGAGSIAMSVALPVSPRRYQGAAVAYWVESEQLSTSVLERLQDAVVPAADAVPQVQAEVVDAVRARIRALLGQAPGSG